MVRGAVHLHGQPGPRPVEVDLATGDKGRSRRRQAADAAQGDKAALRLACHVVVLGAVAGEHTPEPVRAPAAGDSPEGLFHSTQVEEPPDLRFVNRPAQPRVAEQLG